jgi:protein N-terminal methyltransferase
MPLRAGQKWWVLSLLLSGAALADDAASLSDVLTASIIKKRGTFWAVSQNADGSEDRFDSIGALIAARGPVGGPASLAHWAAQPATMEGVVGARWAESSPLDLSHSTDFIARFARAQRARRGGDGDGGGGAPRRCLHVGAGIGRETGVLLDAGGCATVDLVEPHAHMLAAATVRLTAGALGEVWALPAEAHDFGGAPRYDLILMQWFTNYVSDEDLARVLERAAGALLPGGGVILKDNVSEFADGVHSAALAHVIRSAAYLEAIVEAGAPALKKLADEAQLPWVGGLFPVRAMALVRAAEPGWEWEEAVLVPPQ